LGAESFCYKERRAPDRWYLTFSRKCQPASARPLFSELVFQTLFSLHLLAAALFIFSFLIIFNFLCGLLPVFLHFTSCHMLTTQPLKRPLAFIGSTIASNPIFTFLHVYYFFQRKKICCLEEGEASSSETLSSIKLHSLDFI
jgi:hypothetical protein